MSMKVILILFFLSSIGIILSIFTFSQPFLGYETRWVSFDSATQDPLSGTLYIPKNTESENIKKPAFLSVHYGLQKREALEPAAGYLAENGIIVLDIILKGKRNIDNKSKSFEDYLWDVQAGIQYLKNHPHVDPARIYISGHSIGANLTSMVGDSHKDVRGVIAVGYPVNFSPTSSQDFLMTAGVFDELHPTSKMLSYFEETRRTENKTEKGKIKQGENPKPHKENENPPHNEDKKCVSHNSGILFKTDQILSFTSSPSCSPSRLYYISFLSDHYIEPDDPHITRAIALFILGQKPRIPLLKSMEMIFVIRIFLFFSLFFLTTAGFTEVAVKTKEIKNKLIRERIPALILLLLFIIIGLLHHSNNHLIPIYILSAFTLGIVANNHFIRKLESRKLLSPENEKDYMKFLLMDVKKVSLVFFLFYGCYIFGLYIHAGLYPYSRWDYLWRTLTGVWFLVTGQFFVLGTRINGLFLHPDHSFNFLSPVVLGILLGELIYPGLIGKIFDEFFSRLVGSLQNLDFKIKFQIYPAQALLLVVVIIAVIMVWRQILSEGYSFGFDELMGMVYLFFSFIVIPPLVFTLFIRNGKIRNILKTLSPGGVYEKTQKG